MSSVEHRVGEAGNVFCGREEAGVSRHATEDEGVFVLNYALNDSLAEGAVGISLSLIGGRRNFCTHVRRGVERGVGHCQWPEDFALAETIERFSVDAFERRAQDDESDVAIFGSGAGIVGEGSDEGGAQEFVAQVRLEEKFFVSGQTRGMGQQHAESNVPAARIGATARASQKFRNCADHRSIEFEQAAFVQNRCHGCGGDCFGEGSEVEKCRHFNATILALQVFFIREAAEGR